MFKNLNKLHVDGNREGCLFHVDGSSVEKVDATVLLQWKERLKPFRNKVE
jgi:hypothetical protein